MIGWDRKSTLESKMINVVDNRYIFIHIPKCAGTSIAKAIGLGDITSHMKACEIRKSIGWFRYSTLFKFAFVRNPWSRFLSLYNYARMEESYYHSSIHPSKAKYGKHLDYDLLKDASLNDCANLLINGELLHDKQWNHWMPQYTWLFNKKGNSNIVNFIGKVEHMEQELQILKDKLKIQIRIEKLNESSTHTNYQDFYDNKTKRIVDRYYEKDIRSLGYKF
ncbi:MAG: sulfotransferase family 2 domain-containing protein [Cyclobacteriaceae bacterium]